MKNYSNISLSELKTALKSYKKFTYRNGLMLDYEDRDDIILTEAELNSNMIIDYSKNNLNLENLNAYLISQGKEPVTYIAKRLKTFTTNSYFCDIDNEVYELGNEGWNTGRRKLEVIKEEDVEEVINCANQYLMDLLKDDGEFVYGYSAVKNEELEGYNRIRHAGAIWLLAQKEDLTEKEKQKIILAIEYLVNNIEYYDEETAFVLYSSKKVGSVGANALTLLALCEYMNKLQDFQYLDLAKKIGNGIIAMQNEDGTFNHRIKLDDFSVYQKFVVEYYDNESTYALCELYGITKEDKYLESAEKALDNFIENDFFEYHNNWFSYALNEVTKYVDEERYYVAGLKNVEDSLDIIINKQHTSHTDFELLMQGFELYDRIIEKKLDIEGFDKFPAKKFLEAIRI